MTEGNEKDNSDDFLITDGTGLTNHDRKNNYTGFVKILDTKDNANDSKIRKFTGNSIINRRFSSINYWKIK